MKLIEDAILGIADEVTMNPDVVTRNTIHYTNYLMAHKEETQDIESVESMMHEISQYGKWQQRIYLLSVLTYYSRNNKYIIEMIDYINEHFDDISLASLNYIRSQIESIVFNHSDLASNEIAIMQWKLYDRIMDRYTLFFSDEIEDPVEQANDGLVIVFTEQVLSSLHAPTKAALDRCKILIEQIKKTVILINTAEMQTTVGMIPFYNSQGGLYNEDLLNQETIEWKGVSIPYVQLKNNMPESNDVRDMIRLIRSLKPSYGISIGGGSVVLSLLSKVMPILTISMTSSILPTKAIYQSFIKEITEEDRIFLEAVGKDEKHLIKTSFGFSVVDVEDAKTKESLGLKVEDFIIAIVGNRLDKEANQEFWDMLDKCSLSNLQVLVFGATLDEIKPNIEKFEGIKNRVHCLGFQPDLRGYMCAADLYVNPKRMGGGTSAVEAMSLGVPVVSTNYGDVAINCGEDFVVETYEEMSNVIKKYSSDEDFYSSQSKKAEKRAEELLDRDGAFVELINEFENRIREKI